MANRQCNPTKRVNTAQGLRFCAVVLSANGRVKPDVVLIGDKEERHAEGAYYLDWREGLPWHLVATAASVNFSIILNAHRTASLIVASTLELALELS